MMILLYTINLSKMAIVLLADDFTTYCLRKQSLNTDYRLIIFKALFGYDSAAQF